MKWFKRKDLSVDEKIKRATLRKKCQMVGMFVIGVLGGIGWTVVFFIGREVISDITSPVVISVARAEVVEDNAEVVEDVAEWSEAVFTAYSAGDGYTPGTTMASGREVYVGAIACPRSIPLGSVVEVRGLGRYTCEDRKALRFDGEFDIYSESIDEAIEFGRKSLYYRIIEGA